ncbi:MAG: hypothetical protein Q4E69_06660 [Bacilli bacterium]|nr:hypothetical protein [Bacilli bacterium]
MKLSKRNVAIALNILLVICEIWAFVVTFQEMGKLTPMYYTEESNFLAMISSILFVFFALTKKEIPKWVSYLKYMATIGLTLTILVVIFILCPQNGNNYVYMLFYKSLFIHHFAGPILYFILFVFLEGNKISTVKENFIGMIFTLIYGAIIMPLNIMKVIEGPYPFLMVYKQPVWASILWVAFLLSFAYMIGFVIRKLSCKFYK